MNKYQIFLNYKINQLVSLKILNNGLTYKIDISNIYVFENKEIYLFQLSFMVFII